MTKQISILGIPFKIEEVEVVNKYIPSNGEINYDECIIRIDKNLPVELKNRVLMHEIVHGMLNLLGYTDDAENELKVQSIATALHLLFKSSDPIFYA
jgi:hypothetical protein